MITKRVPDLHYSHWSQNEHQGLLWKKTGKRTYQNIKIYLSGCMLPCITWATFETPKYPRRPRDQYTAQLVNTLELSAPPPNRGKKNLQPGNQPGDASNNKCICSSKKWSHCETVALWNSLLTWKLAQYLSDVTGRPTVNGIQVCHLTVVAVLLIPFVRYVHLHQYSWFGRIPSAVANRYRKSASLLKRSVLITSIS